MSEYALSILVRLWANPKLVDRLAEYCDPMITTHYKTLPDFLNHLSDRQIAKIIPSIWIWEYDVQYCYEFDAIELAFGELFRKKKKLPEGTTIHDLTDSQQLVLKLIADDTSTGQESRYRYTLESIGISSPVHRKDESSARENLMRFLNGEKLEYDR